LVGGLAGRPLGRAGAHAGKEVTMRKGTIVAGCLSAAVLAVLVGRLPAQTPPAQKPAAVVNGEVVPMAELEKLLKDRPQSPYPQTVKEQAEVRDIALKMLIDDVLIRQFLKKTMPPANPTDIAKELAELQQALANQKPPRTVQDFLRDTHQTEQELRTDIAARLQWKAYATAAMPDQAIKLYYDQNKVFFDKVMVRASHILLRVPDKASEPEKTAIRNKLLAIRQEIAAGKIDFAQAAKTYSDCPSKVNGGDIGFFPYKFAVYPSFAQAAFSMKIGDLSDPVQTEFGYHIIKVTDRKNGEASNFEAVKDLVRDVKAQEDELYPRVIAEQRKTAQIQISPP
jgi:peptidyl-prolyl cis-trans isomerase C